MKWILGVSTVAVIVGLAATMTVPGQTVTPNQTILKLFPAETQGIAYVDVAGLRGAPLFNEMIMQKLPQLPAEVSQFAQATGFNIEQDVDHITAGHVGAQDMLVVVEARYDHFKVEQYLKDKADHLASETYLGRVIYSPDVPSAEHAPGGVSFIDNLIVAGNVSAIKQAIDRMAATAPSVIDNSGMMAQIRTITLGSQVWAVGSFDPAMITARIPATGPAGNLIQSLKGGTYQIRVDQDVHVKASSDFTSADMAKATTDMLRGVVAMAKLQVSQDDSLAHLLDSLSIENSGANLTVSLSASADLLRQLQSSHAKLGTGFRH